MVQLQTKIEIPASEWKIEGDAKVLLLGSCFADEIGEKFVRGGFDAMVNPFGTLYNPASIAVLLHRSVSELMTEPNAELHSANSWVFQDEQNGLWHSWMHHTKFSSESKAALVGRINSTAKAVGEFVRNADVLVITLGTSIIYRLKSSDMLVANCHKQVDTMFYRQRLSASDIVAQWKVLLQILQSVNPHIKVIFTVSPIRHKRDGMHVNQISKGILLQAVDELVHGDETEGMCAYFPSYEIMLDELRDYRYYADDMIHPSHLAVDYIWESFQNTYFTNKTKDIVAKAEKEWRRKCHREITGHLN